MFVVLEKEEKEEGKKGGKKKLTKSFGRFGLHPEALHLGCNVASVQFHDWFVVGANHGRR